MGKGSWNLSNLEDSGFLGLSAPFSDLGALGPRSR